ncbi:MAG: MucR family transcriptional regulator [Rhodospirillales bacterium]
MNDQTDAKYSHNDILRLTADIAASYLGNNTLPAAQIPEVISTVYGALSGLNGAGGAKADAPKPAVPVKKSITNDYIVCLEDGKRLKMLKRHLRTTYGMTPDEYRAKWGLGADYPMVAPNYAQQRSAFAKKIGLGRTANKARARKGKG